MKIIKKEIKKEYKERKIQEIMQNARLHFGKVESSFIRKFSETEFNKYYKVV